jgi:hypothetical protein
MPPALSDDQVRLLRLRSQRLAGERATGVADLVAGMVGLQAQHTPASRLAVRPRSSGLDAAAAARACNQERSVVRTWAMRGTLHMVAAEDVGWLVDLLGPRSAAAGRRRRRQLGLDDDDLGRRALPAIREILAGGGGCTRAELVRRLAAAGVAVDAWLLGYRSRDLVLAPRFARRIRAGGGWIQPAVVVDGRVVGTWHQQRKDDRLTVTVTPFERLDPATRPGLEAETADLGSFLHAEATLAVEG